MAVEKDILQVITRICQDVVQDLGISDAKLCHMVKKATTTKQFQYKSLRALDNVVIKGYKEADTTELCVLILHVLMPYGSSFIKMNQYNMRDDVLHLKRIRNRLSHRHDLSSAACMEYIEELADLAGRFESYLKGSIKSYRKDIFDIWKKITEPIERKKAPTKAVKKQKHHCDHVSGSKAPTPVENITDNNEHYCKAPEYREHEYHRSTSTDNFTIYQHQESNDVYMTLGNTHKENRDTRSKTYYDEYEFTDSNGEDEECKFQGSNVSVNPSEHRKSQDHNKEHGKEHGHMKPKQSTPSSCSNNTGYLTTHMQGGVVSLKQIHQLSNRENAQDHTRITGRHNAVNKSEIKQHRPEEHAMAILQSTKDDSADGMYEMHDKITGRHNAVNKSEIKQQRPEEHAMAIFQSTKVDFADGMHEIHDKITGRHNAVNKYEIKQQRPEEHAMAILQSTKVDFANGMHEMHDKITGRHNAVNKSEIKQQRPEEHAMAILQSTNDDFADGMHEMHDKKMIQCNTVWHRRRDTEHDVKDRRSFIQNKACSDSTDVTRIVNEVVTEDSKTHNDVLMSLLRHISDDEIEELQSLIIPGHFKQHVLPPVSKLLPLLIDWKNQKMESHDNNRYMHPNLIRIDYQKANTLQSVLSSLELAEIPINAISVQREAGQQNKKRNDILFLYCLEDREKAEYYMALTKANVSNEIGHIHFEMLENVVIPGQIELFSFLNASSQSKISVIVVTDAMISSKEELSKAQMVLINLLTDEQFLDDHVVLMVDKNCKIPEILSLFRYFKEEDLVKKTPEVKSQLIELCKKAQLKPCQFKETQV